MSTWISTWVTGVIPRSPTWLLDHVFRSAGRVWSDGSRTAHGRLWAGARRGRGNLRHVPDVVSDDVVSEDDEASESVVAEAVVPEFASAVLDVVDRIPPGKVMTYGDVAEYLGRGGPRQVGQAMARWGGAVAWWRVVKSDGSPPPGYEDHAVRQYREEGTPLRPDGRRVDLRRARWDGTRG